MYHIVIDIGHSRRDQGAESASGLTEHAYWSSHAPAMASLLKRWGHKVTLVQRDDYDGTIARECLEINRLDPDLIVSLHLNSSDNPAASGHEVIHYPGSLKGKRLAMAINSDLGSMLPTPDRGVKTPCDSRGLAFLRATRAPAVIVEPAFLSSSQDLDILEDPHNQIVYSIAHGIDYYTQQI